MKRTLRELIEVLKTYDEVTLLELLDISSEDLVERFRDNIVSRQDYIKKEVEANDYEEDDSSDCVVGLSSIRWVADWDEETYDE